MKTSNSASCATCVHFTNAPEALERDIPGLRSLGSGFASVRDRDGLCRLHARYLPASAGCSGHASRASGVSAGG